jgi:hypothetical protein
MQFDAADFDWAYGELLHLFGQAHHRYCLPHELNPALFYAAWSVLNAQPFEVRDRCQKALMAVWVRPDVYRGRLPTKRYENVWAH